MKNQTLFSKIGFAVYGILVISLNTNGQAPAEMSYYLNNKEVSKTAKDFYNGKFKAADDDRTFSIIDSLNTKNHTTRPFYIYLVSQIAKNADGALSESLSVSCRDFVESHPNDVIEFLYSSSPIVKKEFISIWAQQVAWEIQLSCEDSERECLRRLLRATMKKSKSTNKDQLREFFSEMESYFMKKA